MRLECLECVGLFLSLQPQDIILQYLEGMLLPRMQRVLSITSFPLPNMCHRCFEVRSACESRKSMEKKELLFEIKTISALVSTLERPNGNSSHYPYLFPKVISIFQRPTKRSDLWHQ